MQQVRQPVGQLVRRPATLRAQHQLRSDNVITKDSHDVRVRAPGTAAGHRSVASAQAIPVVEIRARLTAAGLPVDGTKSTVAARLYDYVSTLPVPSPAGDPPGNDSSGDSVADDSNGRAADVRRRGRSSRDARAAKAHDDAAHTKAPTRTAPTRTAAARTAAAAAPDRAHSRLRPPQALVR